MQSKSKPQLAATLLVFVAASSTISTSASTQCVIFDSGVKSQFHALAKEWRIATEDSSSIKEKISHPAYLKIIGLGPDVVPLILQEMNRSPDYWFSALAALVVSPVPKEAKKFSEFHDAWISWGKERGYV